MSRLQPAAWREAAGRYLATLFDLQMRTIVTTEMMPVIYLVGIIGVFFGCVSLAADAFSRSVVFGAFWLVVVTPVIFVVGVTAVRVVLEFFLSVFRLLAHVESLRDQTQEIAGQTGVLINDLPRIKFWKAWRRDENPADSGDASVGDVKE